MDETIKSEKKSIFIFVIACFLIYLLLAFMPYILHDKQAVFSYLQGSLNYEYPRWNAVFLYIIGLASLVIGFFLPKIFKIKTPKLKERIGTVFSDKTFKIIFILYLISVLANVLVFVLGKGLPILNITLRNTVDSKLIVIASLQYLYLPIIIVWSIARKKPKIGILLFILSFILLSLLAARNIVFRSVLAVFLTLFLFDKQLMKKTLFWFFLGFIIIFLTVGLVSKSLIYKEKYPLPKLFYAPFQLAFTDSLSSFYNLDKLKQKIDTNGSLKGVALKDSFLNIIPGADVTYANYKIGEIITGEDLRTRQLGNQVFDVHLSLAATDVAVFYIDFKILGVIIAMMILGFIFSILTDISLRNLKFLFILSPFMIELIYSAYAGVYGPNSIIILIITIIGIGWFFIKAKKINNLA